MDFKEAKQFLNDNGYLLEDTEVLEDDVEEIKPDVDWEKYYKRSFENNINKALSDVVHSIMYEEELEDAGIYYELIDEAIDFLITKLQERKKQKEDVEVAVDENEIKERVKDRIKDFQYGRMRFKNKEEVKIAARTFRENGYYTEINGNEVKYASTDDKI